MRFQERLIRKSLQGIHCIPGKPSQLFYSLHTAALNPVISPKEHFSATITVTHPLPYQATGRGQKPPKITLLSPQLRPPGASFAPKQRFFWAAASPAVARPLYTLVAGTRQLQKRRRPAGPRGKEGPSTGPQVEEESRFPLPWATTYIDSHFQVRRQKPPKSFTEAQFIPLLFLFFHKVNQRE